MRRGRYSAGLVLAAFSGALTVLPWMHTLHHRDDHVHVDGAIVFLDRGLGQGHGHDHGVRTGTRTRTRDGGAGLDASGGGTGGGARGAGARRRFHPRRYGLSRCHTPGIALERLPAPAAAGRTGPGFAAHPPGDARTAAPGWFGRPHRVATGRFRRRLGLRPLRARVSRRRVVTSGGGRPAVRLGPRSARCSRLFVPLVILSIALPATAVAQAADAAAPDAGAPDVTPAPSRWRAGGSAAPAPALARAAAGPARARPARAAATALRDGGDRPATADRRLVASRARSRLPAAARARVQDILLAMPGIVIAQHAGGGKANQYFLRGFDADHGTDMALSSMACPSTGRPTGTARGLRIRTSSSRNSSSGWRARRGPTSRARVTSRPPARSTWSPAQRSTARRGTTFGAHGLSGTWLRPRRGPCSGDCEPQARGCFEATFAAELARTNGPFDLPEGWDRYKLFNRLTVPSDRRRPRSPSSR